MAPVWEISSPPGGLMVTVTGTSLSVTSPWFCTVTSKPRSALAETVGHAVADERDVAGLRDHVLTRATPWMPESLVELPTLVSICCRPRRGRRCAT